MSRYHPKLVLGLLLAMLWMDRPAEAYTQYCVGDVGALNAALLAAESTSSATVIHLQTQGSPYHIGNTELMDSQSDFNELKILGGYDSTCANRTLNPENTVIDGDGTNVSRGLRMQGTLMIEGVRFQDFGSNGLNIQTDSTDGITTAVRNSEFIGMGLSVAEYCGDHDNVLIDNNLVVGAPGDGIGLASQCLSTSPTLHATNLNFIEATGNTVVNNAGKGINVFSAGSTSLFNNIIWGNGGIDIFLQTGGIDASPPAAGTAFLDDNTFDSSSIFGNHASGSSGDDPSDPLFVDPTNGNYRLQTVKDGFPANSPAANTGTSSAPFLTAVDLDGNPRIVGSEPDRGAYESDWDDTAISSTLEVTSAQDTSGNCSQGSTTCTLRQAITDANNNTGTHTITFNIPGNCPQVITTSGLPYITNSVVIEGFSQPGSAQNTATYGDNAVRCIVLDGGGASEQGLVFTTPVPSQNIVQGLAFEGFGGSGGGAALNFSGGQNDQATGNQFGGKMVAKAGGLQLTPNNQDIWIYGANTTAQIGGFNAFQRNIIATANGSDPNYGGRGIAIPAGGGSSGNTIQNNLIGMDYQESTTGGNAIGIQIETSGNSVSGNVIGNNNNGIQVLGSGASGNTIINNLIGLGEPLCLPRLPPATGCLWIDGFSTPNQAGIYFWQGAHDNNTWVNTITNNSIYGIVVVNPGTQHNLISGNSIYANASEIVLDGYSYGYNDPSSTAANRGLNYPLIGGAEGGNLNGVVYGQLQSSNDTYAVEAYASFQCDSSGHGPGEQYLGAQTVTISNAPSGGNGSASFSVNLHAPSWYSLAGKQITFTATDSAHSTSQFSACSAYRCDVIFRHGFDTTTAEKCP